MPMPKGHRTQKVRDRADRVWIHLWNAGPNGMSFAEVRRAEGLTWSEARHALAYINRELQASERQPIVSQHHGRRVVYVLPDFVIDAKEYSENRLRDLRTRLRTEFTRLEATRARWPREIHRITMRSIERVIEDVDDLISQV